MRAGRRFALTGIYVLIAIVLGTLLADQTFSVSGAKQVVGVLAALCVAGIVYGLAEARRIELRRRAKLDIWLNH